MRHRLAGLILLLACLLAGSARADTIHVGHFSLLTGNQGANSYELLADLPADLATDSAITWPAGCMAGDETRQTIAGRTRLSLHFACTGGLPADAMIRLPWKLDGASLRPQGGKHISILPAAGLISLPVGASLTGPRPLATLAGDYLWQGVSHILTGWDHLAFVLCLCLLAQGRHLLLLVTLFTLGHSISLAGGFYDWISLPMPPVEAVIALSILFMAREALAGFGPGDWRRQALITGGFGLLHGLGFASALGEMAVPADDRLPALLFFNLGVEAGQLLFVAAVLALLAVASRSGRAAMMRAVSLHAAGAMAAFWLLQRLAGFGSA
jgi:hypothetical protein